MSSHLVRLAPAYFKIRAGVLYVRPGMDSHSIVISDEVRYMIYQYSLPHFTGLGLTLAAQKQYEKEQRGEITARTAQHMHKLG